MQEGKDAAFAEDEDEVERESADKKPLRTTFELADTLYAEAELEDTDTVYLWLGVRLHPSHLRTLPLAPIYQRALIRVGGLPGERDVVV